MSGSDGKSGKHRPRKRFGQHFLRDQHVIDRIVSAINPQADELIIEIGPGEGVLTEPLLASPAQVKVIELDRDLAARLNARFPDLEVISQDALTVDLAQLSDGRRFKLVGNLPYNVSTPILFHALEQSALIDDMIFMLQREVVDRMVSAPGSKTYGRLSVMLQHRCQLQRLFTVPPGAFAPPPKVQSAVVRMQPIEQPAGPAAQLDQVVRAAFAKRRKTIANALKELLSRDQIEAIGVDPNSRAEQLDVAQFVTLAEAITPGSD